MVGHDTLTNIVNDNYKKDIVDDNFPNDWKELCQLYISKYKSKICIIDKYIRPGFDGKQAIFIQTMNAGEGLLFCENGYVLDTINRSIIAMLNVKQVWKIIQAYFNK